MKHFLLILVIALAFVKPTAQNYTNPVVATSLPDPTIIKGTDGYFYLYATEDIRNLPIYRSTDLVNWTFGRTAFTNTTRPTFEPNGGLWAPDINYIDGRYVLYYSMSVWGGEETCGVGVAIADSPKGPFSDMGKLFRSNEIGVTNSIDPFYIEEDGMKYLFWGSFRGLYYVQLSDNGLALKNPSSPQPTKIAGTAFEGAYIYKKGDYYYLFASIGSCCRKLESTYKLVVGRSTSLTGPYLNKSGNAMMSNNYSIVVGHNERFVGNGHCSEIVQDDAGNDWMLFHGWDKNNADNGRVLLLNQIKWDNNDWPYVDSNSPATTAPKPVFWASGIDENEFTTIKIKISDKILTIDSQLSANVKVFSLNGTLVENTEGRNSFKFLLSQGSYIVRVSTANNSIVKKVIVA